MDRHRSTSALSLSLSFLFFHVLLTLDRQHALVQLSQRMGQREKERLFHASGRTLAYRYVVSRPPLPPHINLGSHAL